MHLEHLSVMHCSLTLPKDEQKYDTVWYYLSHQSSERLVLVRAHADDLTNCQAAQTFPNLHSTKPSVAAFFNFS